MPINGALLSVLDRRRPELVHPSATRASYTYVDFKVPKVTFSLGWELEANIRAARVPEGVDLISDGSVNDDSAEYIVRPTLVKSARYVLGLLKDLVHSPKLNTDKSCGFHVHLAPRNVSLTVMRKWALICQMLAQRVEASAFKAVPDSRGDNSFCRPIRPLQVGTMFAATKYSNAFRYQWLNIVEMFRPSGIRTVEVRLLGNTHRWKYVSAWVLFSLQLGSEAWKVLHNPLAIEKSIECLTFLLTKIADEIKPLDKSSEPIPPWVYAGLNLLGIDTKVWDKPLAEIVKIEYKLRGLEPVTYSDRQPTSERARRNNDEDDNRCECGCGEDGRCLDQIHNDGDCDSNECHRCCENGDCSGSPSCDNCQDRAHEDLEYCGLQTCRRCLATGRIPRELPLTSNVEAPITQAEADTVGEPSLAGQPITATEASGAFPGVVHPSNIAEINGRMWIASTPIAPNEFYSAAIDNPDNYGPHLIGIEMPISDDEMTMSRDREAFYINGGTH